MKLEDIEKRFCEVTNLNIDLTVFPIKECDNIKTNKEKSKKYGQVFTPIFLVDQMIEMAELDPNIKYLDLCAGKGQYGIRLLRALTNKFPDFDLDEFMKNHLWFIEIQEESCKDLQYIFGENINLYCGDAFNLKYSEETDRGVLHFDGKNWVKEC